MKELNTYRDVLQAILDGYEVEYWNETLDSWLPLEYFQGYSKSIDKKITPGIHRIKLSKPSIDWSQVSDKYNFLTRSKNGHAYLHTIEPKLGCASWYTLLAEEGYSANADTHQSYTPGNCDWKDSLIQRPEGI